MKFILFAAVVAHLAHCVNGNPTPHDVEPREDANGHGHGHRYLHRLRYRQANNDVESELSTEANPDGKSFILEQVKNPNYTKPDAQHAMLMAYTRYSKDLPQAIKNIIKAVRPIINPRDSGPITQQGVVEASPPPYYDTQYAIPVRIGTPPKTYNLNLDTGSADLWVLSTDTQLSSPSSNFNLYNPKNSKSNKLVKGQNWTIQYADGAGASGLVYTDWVRVGTTYFSRQAVESAIKVSNEIEAYPFASGMIGMAFSDMNTVRPTKQKTYMDNIKNFLALPVFTANLQKGKPGTFNFGFIDKTQYTGLITYSPVDTDTSYWKFPVSGYQIGKDAYKNYSWRAVVDTGSTLIHLPQPIVDAYYAKVPGAKLDPSLGMVTFPCNTALPDFVFGVKSYRGLVPGNYINFGQASSTHCYGGIQTANGLPYSIFGNVLLKAQFVVFNVGSRTVGFANKKLIK